MALGLVSNNIVVIAYFGYFLEERYLNEFGIGEV